VREDIPVTGPLMGRQNIIHHHSPRYFTRLRWWQSSWDLFCLSAVIVLIGWRLHLPSGPVWLFAALSANANEVHKWAPRTRKENGPLISFLRDIRLTQTLLYSRLKQEGRIIRDKAWELCTCSTLTLHRRT
jgi:ubiquitin-conjugating enzyme E2 variant